MKASLCYSCGKTCNGPRFHALNEDSDIVYVGPDCLKKAAMAGKNGYFNERTGVVIYPIPPELDDED